MRQDMEASGVLKAHRQEMYQVRQWELDGESAPYFTPQYEHRLNLQPDAQVAIDGLYWAVAEQHDVRMTHALVQRVLPGVSEHGMRTAKSAGGMAYLVGLAPEEIRLAENAGLDHDIGQVDPRILQVKQSPYTFAERPELRRAMQRHPWVSVEMLMALHADPNRLILAGGHHLTLPKDRGEPYGLLANEKGFPDEKGRRPDIRIVLECLQVADVVDALVRPEQPELADPGRRYRRDQPGGYDTALTVVASMEISDKVKQAAHDIYAREVSIRSA